MMNERPISYEELRKHADEMISRVDTKKGAKKYEAEDVQAQVFSCICHAIRFDSAHLQELLHEAIEYVLEDADGNCGWRKNIENVSVDKARVLVYAVMYAHLVGGDEVGSYCRKFCGYSSVFNHRFYYICDIVLNIFAYIQGLYETYPECRDDYKAVIAAGAFMLKFADKAAFVRDGNAGFFVHGLHTLNDNYHAMVTAGYDISINETRFYIEAAQAQMDEYHTNDLGDYVSVWFYVKANMLAILYEKLPDADYTLDERVTIRSKIVHCLQKSLAASEGEEKEYIDKLHTLLDKWATQA